MEKAFPRATRKVSWEFRKRVGLEFQAGDKRASQICREQDISDSLLRRWVQQYREHGEGAWRQGLKRVRPPSHTLTAPQAIQATAGSATQ